jgi:ornithine carbamoyltransferase
MKKDLVSVTDLTREEILELFRCAKDQKRKFKEGKGEKPLSDKTLAMIFEKPSLRTRVTFETAMTQLGGHAIYLAPSDIGLGKRESVPDVAKNLSRWVDGIMARTFAHQTVADLAKNASIPVVNALSDQEHPCQILADFFTIYERQRHLDRIKLTYIGDGNNVCNSLLLAAGLLGTQMTVACPRGYEPSEEVLSLAKRLARESRARIEVLRVPEEAVEGADVVYTDVWASMGQEAEAARRAKVFARYQVNEKLLSNAKEDVMVMHCLPAHRGLEITDEVLDGPNSIVLDEAENRLHIQKAIMVKLMSTKLETKNLL